MTAYVSLFRGINVGANKVRMADLKAMHEELDCQRVVTYLQTGNVVFTSSEADPLQLAARLEESFAQKFGFRVMVTLRTAEQIDQVVACNPFPEQTLNTPKWVVVFFLNTQPARTALEDLRRTYTGPELFQLSGQELYLYYGEGIGNSKLTNTLLEKRLQASGTGRNWNTILALQHMLHR